jgi:nicotinamidase-related amidase
MIIDLPVRFYRAVPSDQPEGLVEERWSLDSGQTAFVELHCWNVGCPGGPAVPKDYWVFMGSLDNHRRMWPIVRDVIAPAREAARRGGIAVVHVQPESIARRYEHLQPALPRPGAGCSAGELEPGRAGEAAGFAVRLSPALLDTFPAGLEAGQGGPISDNAKRRANRVHGEGYMQWDGWDQLDVAQPLRPRDDETVIVSTAQFQAWASQRHITTLIFTGFCTNLCIVDSPAAMRAMSGLGYRCVILREGTLAVEFPDMPRTQHTDAALRYIEAWIGYSASTADFMKACGP